MKKVCIAIDISPSAQKVATVGFEYAKALNAEVVLVHVVHDASAYVYDYAPIMEYSGFLINRNVEFVEGLREETEKFLKATAKYLGEPDLQTKVLQGYTNDEVMKFVQLWEADLLVIGTHSHSILEKVLMGNTATKIVKHSKIPLLVVPIKKL